LRAIALISDAYGGRGGIALYNRNFVKALASFPGMGQILAVPRSITYELEEMPTNVTYLSKAARGKLWYLFCCLKLALFAKPADLIICGHLHLLPFAWVLKLRHRCPIVTLAYGVESWTPTSHAIVNRLCSRLEWVISIRNLTAHRLQGWANASSASYFYLPNCVDEEQYGIAAKRADLIEKHDLMGKRVIMTAGRLDAIEFDRKKGFDEVLEILPELRCQEPKIMYIIVGDGDDSGRLRKKASDLGVSDIVRFVGYVSNEEKADYYRLADVFAMPGSNPIFDRYPFRFVFLEALACGVPVVGCVLEDPSERDDEDASKLIIQVDPNDGADIVRGILTGLAIEGPSMKPEITRYFFPAFEEKLHDHLRYILREGAL